MKALLIDPEAQTITEVECDGSIKDIYRHIDADCFDCVRLNAEADTLYLDDNGLYTRNHFFRFQGHDSPFAGKGLVLGTDSQGESVSPLTETTETLEKSVVFITHNQAIIMGEWLDAVNHEAMESNPNLICMPVADIIKDRAYSDESDKDKR